MLQKHDKFLMLEVEKLKAFIYKFIHINNAKSDMKEKSTVKTNTMQEDFEVLKLLIEGKINIKELDNELKQRLITICNNRLNYVNKKNNEKDIEISRLEKILANYE